MTQLTTNRIYVDLVSTRLKADHPASMSESAIALRITVTAATKSIIVHLSIYASLGLANHRNESSAQLGTTADTLQYRSNLSVDLVS
jgi:hypothetical protein